MTSRFYDCPSTGITCSNVACDEGTCQLTQQVFKEAAAEEALTMFDLIEAWQEAVKALARATVERARMNRLMMFVRDSDPELTRKDLRDWAKAMQAHEAAKTTLDEATTALRLCHEALVEFNSES